MWTLSIIIRESTGQLEEYNLSADEDQSWISAITPPMDFCWATPHRCKKDPSNYKLACQTIIICSIYPEITTAFGELTDICLYVPIKRSVTTVRPRLAKLPIKSQEISQQHIGQKQKPTRLCLSGTAWRHAGWWLTYPSEKYESQLGLWHSQYDGKHKIHFSNNQPAWYWGDSEFQATQKATSGTERPPQGKRGQDLFHYQKSKDINTTNRSGKSV